MANEGIAKWFGLKSSNFILDPKTDSDFYARRTGIDINSIVSNLQIDLVTDISPKRFFWGIYGGGKTHTLFKVSKELEKHIPIYTVYVECPNVSKKSTFLHLYHDGIMASMGQDFIITLFKELIKKIGLVDREELEKRLRAIIDNAELSKAIASLLGADPSKLLSFWRYLCGVSVPPRDLNELDQTEDLTNAEPTKLAAIILGIGKVIKEVQGKTLVLLLDELDRLQIVTNEASALSFQNAFRILSDPNQKDVATIMGCSAVSINEIPDAFGQAGERAALGPVLSKIGRSNLIEIPQLNQSDIDEFIKEVIEYLREPGVDISKKIAEVKRSSKEDFNSDFFPFSKEAIEALKSALGHAMTPREITLKMTQAIGRAFLMKKSFISQDVIG